MSIYLSIGRRSSWLSLAVAIGHHSMQCDQRWYGIRIGQLRLGYRTRGDATPDLDNYNDGGFWFPWQTRRTCSGAWL